MTPPFTRKSPLAAAVAETGTPPAAPPVTARDEAERPARRLRLWELADRFHCPLIGTCLSLDDLTRFARRHGLGGDLGNEYLLHVDAVGRAASRNRVAEDMHRHLERKYADWVARFERLKSDAEVLALWKEQFESGEVAGPMWATLTHRAASEATRQIVYGDLHMLSHQVGAGLAADARRLAWLARRNEELAAALERSRADSAGTEAGMRRLQVELKTARAAEAVARAEAGELRERLAAFEAGTAIVDMGQRLMALTAANEELRVAAERGRALHCALAEARQRAALAERERDRLAAERDALERLLLAGDGEAAAHERPCADHAGGVSAQRVLCVGGRTALLAHYGTLARRLGMRLVHHDGGIGESLARLPELINGADAVLCPTDCVSHAAYYQLKRHCKRYGKPCLLFRGAGVSGFAVALARLAAGQTSIAGGEPVPQ